MVRELPPELIEYLLELGASDRYEDCGAIFERFPDTRSGSFMRLAPDPWCDIADLLSHSELTALIKALTVVEQRLPNCQGGSVSAVVWLYRKLSEKSGDDLAALADWILSHTDNPYLPFGSDSNDERSRRLQYEGACQRAAQRLAEQPRSYATIRLFDALGRRDEKAIAASVQQGADIRATNSLGHSAIDIALSLGLSHLFLLRADETVRRD